MSYNGRKMTWIIVIVILSTNMYMSVRETVEGHFGVGNYTAIVCSLVGIIMSCIRIGNIEIEKMLEVYKKTEKEF